MWTKDKVLTHYHEICHANMYYEVPGFDELVTAVPKNDAISLEYLRMLIRGPFRSMAHLIKLDRVHNQYYLHCLNLGQWPANVLMNFCIASRVPIECGFLLEPWAKRCDLGFEPVLAFLLTYSYGGTNKGNLIPQYDSRTFAFPRPGHLWLDPASDWRAILSGVMVKQSVSYKQRPAACRPTNIIWGHSSDYMIIKKMTDEQIAEFYTQPIQVYKQPEVPVPKVKFNKIIPGLNFADQVQYNPFQQVIPPADPLAQMLNNHDHVIQDLLNNPIAPVEEAVHEPEDDEDPGINWDAIEDEF
jgi:hypothetical protein